MAIKNSQSINAQQALISKVLSSKQPLAKSEIIDLAKKANLTDSEVKQLTKLVEQLSSPTKKGVEMLDGHCETSHSWS